MSPQDGSMCSLVGGFDFQKSKFNHVTQAWRQSGSSIKPFIYAAALKCGFAPSTKISDQPINFFVNQNKKQNSVPWIPRNYEQKYEDILTIRQGLYKSKNMVSIRLLEAIGLEFAQ